MSRPPGSLLVTLEDALMPAELDAITAYGDRLARQKASLGKGDTRNDAIRVTRVAWIERNADTAPFYARIEEIVLDLNARFYHYDLFGLTESLQFTIYEGAEGGHYDWHIDHGESVEPRKLSLSIQLSEADSYEGCELQLWAGNAVTTAGKKRGTVICFPSYILHRVTPVTSGTRKSLVIWAAGPEFR